MSREYKLACFNWCCQLLYPAAMVNLIWFTDEKCLLCQLQATEA